jgi:hypothetical protein
MKRGRHTNNSTRLNWKKIDARRFWTREAKIKGGVQYFWRRRRARKTRPVLIIHGGIMNKGFMFWIYPMWGGTLSTRI